MKLVKACIALAAFAAIFVVPSMASATPPTLCETTKDGTCSPVPVGTKLIATNVAHSGTALTTKLVSNVGNVECETATITGELTKNGGGIEGNIETAEFRSTPESDHTAAHCAGGFGGATTPTPNHTSDEVKSLPWCIKATTEDTFTVRGAKCNEAAKPLKFRLHTAFLGTCTYEKPLVAPHVPAGPVVGTYTTHPADAILTIKDQLFTRIEGSSFCPKEGKLNMAFTLTTDEAGVSKEPLYIT